MIIGKIIGFHFDVIVNIRSKLKVIFLFFDSFGLSIFHEMLFKGGALKSPIIIDIEQTKAYLFQCFLSVTSSRRNHSTVVSLNVMECTE
jgi:hypothetical protein